MNDNYYELEKPYIICHMGMSLDGKVTGEFLDMPHCAEALEAYYAVNRELSAMAYACGRVTMEGSFTKGFRPDLTPFLEEVVPPMDYVADENATFFAVAFDRRGRLGWTAPAIEDEDPGYGGAHIIEVLCEGVPQAYLAYLQSVGVSYIFASREGDASELDIALALHKLKAIFGIDKLLLEGGSVLNGAFLRDDLVDELSLILFPATGAEEDKPLFWQSATNRFALEESRLIGAVPHLRYTRAR